MPLELTGKIVKIGNEVTGTSKTGNAWKKVDFMVTYQDGNYDKNAAFSCMGDRVDTISRYHVGDTVKISFNVESREWQDKFFTDLRAWRIEPVQAGGGATSTTNQTNTNIIPPVVEPAPVAPSGPEDDLPF